MRNNCTLFTLPRSLAPLHDDIVSFCLYCLLFTVSFHLHMCMCFTLYVKVLVCVDYMLYVGVYVSVYGDVIFWIRCTSKFCVLCQLLLAWKRLESLL